MRFLMSRWDAKATISNHDSTDGGKGRTGSARRPCSRLKTLGQALQCEGTGTVIRLPSSPQCSLENMAMWATPVIFTTTAATSLSLSRTHPRRAYVRWPLDNIHQGEQRPWHVWPLPETLVASVERRSSSARGPCEPPPSHHREMGERSQVASEEVVVGLRSL